MTDRTFYKIDIMGIVYLIDPLTSKAYTYDLVDPTEIGTLLWTNPKEAPTIDLHPDWVSILTAKSDQLQPTVVESHDVTSKYEGQTGLADDDSGTSQNSA